MLFVTEDAARHLAGVLSSAPDEAVVRLVPRDDHLAMTLDAEQPGDTTIGPCSPFLRRLPKFSGP